MSKTFCEECCETHDTDDMPAKCASCGKCMGNDPSYEDLCDECGEADDECQCPGGEELGPCRCSACTRGSRREIEAEYREEDR